MTSGSGVHRSDPIKLLKIYEIYKEWLEEIRNNGVTTLYLPEETPIGKAIEDLGGLITDAHEHYENWNERKALIDELIILQNITADAEKDWPNIRYGPVTLASDEYHKVLIILEASTTKEQEQYVSKRFFNLIKWSWTRHDPILGLPWITGYLEPLAEELRAKGLTRIQ